MRRAALLGLLSLAALAGTPAPGHAAYAIVDLGTLGGDASEAAGLNEAGDVVGWSTTAAGATHAFRYTGGAMTDLGTMVGGSDSYATAINEQGHVVGYGGINAYGPQFRQWRQGFIWRDGAMQPLGALYCPCTFNQRYGTSAAYAIDDDGAVVGDSGTVRGEMIRHAFLWRDGGMQDIGGGAGNPSVSFAYGIASGRVVGQRDGRAALWHGTTSQDLGTLPGHISSTARGVNASGHVVGESSAGPGQSRAFVWRDGAMHDLGTLPGDGASGATAINGSGLIAGWSRSGDGAVSRAVLWQGGAIVDLNTVLAPGSGWQLTSANAINDAGQIAGVGLHNGQRRAFLLTPVAASTGAALVAAVLPSSRSVQVGQTATAFATLVNAGAARAVACRIELETPVPALFSFQTTDPATNAVTGAPDQPVDIPPGLNQSFVIALTPTAPVPPTDVVFAFSCAGGAAAEVRVGLNTLMLSASTSPVPDIVALAATTSGDGVVSIPGNSGVGIFAGATVNVGASSAITAVADTGPAGLGLAISVCQTDPATSRCISPPGPAVTVPIDANGTPTFGIFVTSDGAVPFDPANHRVFLRFRDASGAIRGSTSVAVRSP